MFEGLKPAEIKAVIRALPQEAWRNASEELKSDKRVGVRKMGDSLAGRILKREQELERLRAMGQNEQALAPWARSLCGVDEAGRGPLAGPVVAGAVILPPGFMPEGLNDSKQVTEAKRDALYDAITANALAWGVGIVEAERIDAINILEATREAMLQAVGELSCTPDFALLDALEIKALGIPHKGVVKGDEKCLCIAAASIIAKVTRDRLMMKLSSVYPGYGFEIHKGYGTPQHYEALRTLGLTPQHRRSFLKGW